MPLLEAVEAAAARPAATAVSVAVAAPPEQAPDDDQPEGEEEERPEEEPEAPGPMPAVVRIWVRVRSPGQGSDDLATLLDAMRHARLIGLEADRGGEQQRADENCPTNAVVHECILLSTGEDARRLWSEYGESAILGDSVNGMVSRPKEEAGQARKPRGSPCHRPHGRAARAIFSGAADDHEDAIPGLPQLPARYRELGNSAYLMGCDWANAQRIHPTIQYPHQNWPDQSRQSCSRWRKTCHLALGYECPSLALPGEW